MMSRRRTFWHWVLCIFVVSGVSMAATSILAAPLPSPMLAARAAGLPDVSAHFIPPGDRVPLRETGRAATGIFLVRDGQAWRAFSNRSTRPRGCVIRWHPDRDRFVDPCCGSAWDRSGRPVAGPALRGLDRYPVTVTPDGWVSVDLAHPQLGPDAYRR